jgi:hypothetical protein
MQVALTPNDVTNTNNFEDFKIFLQTRLNITCKELKNNENWF